MKQHPMQHVRNLLFGLIYLTALVVAAILVYQTLLLTRQLPEPLVIGVPPQPTTVADAPEHSLAMPTAVATIPAPRAPAAVAADLPQTPNHHPKTARYVAAWLPPNFDGGARASFEANMDIIDEASPFWYSTDGSGRLYGTRNDEFVQFAHDNNVLVIPTVHNIGDFEAVIAMLSDPQRRTHHIQNILDEVLARNYDGIDIDYEALDPAMRDDFSAFIIDLAEALHTHNKMLTVAVHAKDSDYGGMGGYQDWTIIGQYADRLRIMTYDYHWRGGGPGPVAPLYWVQSVAEYARTVVDPSKIVIGVPFYGYDWPPEGSARALPWGDIEDLILEEGLEVNIMQRNTLGQPVYESWFSYETEVGTRQVWFMTDDSLESKLNLVQEMDFAGIAIWQLGYEKPEYWDVIRHQLVEDPALIQQAINPLLPEH